MKEEEIRRLVKKIVSKELKKAKEELSREITNQLRGMGEYAECDRIMKAVDNWSR